MNRNENHHVALMGASPDTGNQGVTALCLSALHGLAANDLSTITVYDHGRGRRTTRVQLGDRQLSFERLGATNGKRYYRTDNLRHIELTARLGGAWSDSARTLCRAGAILDVSGGDSFAEIYGRHRFNSVCLTKRIALRAGRPLILLPQTYGPFSTPRGLRSAQDIVRGAAAAWARDPISFVRLVELLGADFDPKRHCLGVDMAFGLPRSKPASPPDPEDQHTLERLSERAPGRTVIGLNVSGLLYNSPQAARSRFKLNNDYRYVVQEILHRLLHDSDADILLIPHVRVATKGSECDRQASDALIETLKLPGDRIRCLHGDYNAVELKWIIGQLDWFCGTRMHATIASLSSGVPTAGLAYSMKMQGVFETCQQRDDVFDLRDLSTGSVVDRVVDSFHRRGTTRQALGKALPGMTATVNQQMALIADQVRSADTR